MLLILAGSPYPNPYLYFEVPYITVTSQAPEQENIYQKKDPTTAQKILTENSQAVKQLTQLILPTQTRILNIDHLIASLKSQIQNGIKNLEVKVEGAYPPLSKEQILALLDTISQMNNARINDKFSWEQIYTLLKHSFVQYVERLEANDIMQLLIVSLPFLSRQHNLSFFHYSLEQCFVKISTAQSLDKGLQSKLLEIFETIIQSDCPEILAKLCIKICKFILSDPS